jgi:hypothetical protein
VSGEFHCPDATCPGHSTTWVQCGDTDPQAAYDRALDSVLLFQHREAVAMRLRHLDRLTALARTHNMEADFRYWREKAERLRLAQFEVPQIPIREKSSR